MSQHPPAKIQLGSNNPPTILKMKVSILWETGAASPDYMADVITMHYSKPTVRGPTLRLVGGKPSFIVAKTKEVYRGFDGGSDSQNSKAKTMEMVLFDGSFTCFVARLNTGVYHKVRDVRLIAGTKITVLDHEFIWMWNESLLETRAVMFISRILTGNYPLSLISLLAKEHPLKWKVGGVNHLVRTCSKTLFFLWS